MATQFMLFTYHWWYWRIRKQILRKLCNLFAVYLTDLIISHDNWASFWIFHHVFLSLFVCRKQVLQHIELKQYPSGVLPFQSFFIFLIFICFIVAKHLNFYLKIRFSIFLSYQFIFSTGSLGFQKKKRIFIHHGNKILRETKLRLIKQDKF